MVFFIISLLAGVARSESGITPRWELTRGIRNPSAVCYDASTRKLYVSSLAGEPTLADGIGWISRAAADGKSVEEQWVSGLNAPKGLRSDGNSLWFTDLQTLFRLDLQTGLPTLRLFIASSRGLDGLALGPDGEVYLADPIANRVYVYRTPRVETFLEGDGLEAPTDLLVQDGKLWVSAKQIVSYDLKTKEKQTHETPGWVDWKSLTLGGDGLFAAVGEHVLRWNRVSPPTEWLPAMGSPGHTAWIEESKILVVPRRTENKVSAFSVAPAGT